MNHPIVFFLATLIIAIAIMSKAFTVLMSIVITYVIYDTIKMIIKDFSK